MGEFTVPPDGIPPPRLEFVYESVSPLTGRNWTGTYPKGLRGWSEGRFGVGTFEGPAIRGRIWSGGDWPYRTDDFTEFDSRSFLETDDGYFIYLQNRGKLYATKELRAKLAAEIPVDPSEYYFRATPVFDAPPESPYAWMSRTMFVAVASRRYDMSVQQRIFRIL